jgi:hypothetical protein
VSIIATVAHGPFIESAMPESVLVAGKKITRIPGVIRAKKLATEEGCQFIL